jgi:hypothetical protein
LFLAERTSAILIVLWLGGTTGPRRELSVWEMKRMPLEVDCYSGRKADERPVRFRLDGQDYLVEELLDHWYGQKDEFFKVRADDRNLYILRHQTAVPEGGWHLVSFLPK